MEDNFDLNDWEALSENSRRSGSDITWWHWLFLIIFIVLIIAVVYAVSYCIGWRIGQLIGWLGTVL